MTYLSINRERLSFILTCGTQPEELKRFFTECKRSLLARGARIRNDPYGHAARVRTICEKLPPTADPVVREWFQKHISLLEPVPVSEIIETFKLYEIAEETAPEDERRRLSRSCLHYLFSPQPPAELVSFLKEGIGPQQAEPAETKVDQGDESEAGGELTTAGLDESIVDLISAMTVGEEVDDILDRLPRDLGTFVSGIMAVRRKDLVSAEMIAGSLLVGSKHQEMLRKCIKMRTASQALEISAIVGLETMDLDPVAEDFDTKADAIIGYCTNSQRESAVFVQPFAVLHGDKISGLSHESRHRLFPHTGDVMAFAGANYPDQPTRGEIGLWQIAEHDTSKKVCFHLASEVSKVYEVAKVPFHSSDPDSVRAFIKDLWTSRKKAWLQPRLYLLADGLIVAPKGAQLDLSRDENFEQPFQSWPKINAISFEGRLLVVGPLSAAAEVYDCAPLGSVAKQLVKTAVEQGTLQSLSRGQMRTLVTSIQATDVGATSQRIRRVREKLDQLCKDQDALSQVVPLLVQHPVVKEMVDKEIEIAVQARVVEKGVLKQEIERLTDERGQIKRKIADLETQQKRTAADAAAIVKTAFDKAVKNGIEALAQAAIISTLSDLPRSSGQISAYVDPIAVSHPNRISHSDLIGTLKELGLDGRMANGLPKVAEVAGASGFLLVLCGLASRVAARSLVSALGEEPAIVDVSIGMTESQQMVETVSKLRERDSLALLNANLSAIDLYGSALIEHTIKRAADPGLKSGPTVVMSLSASAIALPLSGGVEKLSIAIDLDKGVDFSESSKDNDDFLDHLEQTEKMSIRKRLLARLREKLEQLDEPDRLLVSSILRTALAAKDV